MIVVRDGRVVHHELDPALEAKGVRVCDIATCDDDDVARASLGSRVVATTEDAFTVLHDAFLAGGAFVHVPAGVVVEDPIVVLHWCEGDGRRIVPAHARRRSASDAEATVLDRFGSPETDHLVDAVAELIVGDNAHLRYLVAAGARPAHVAPRRSSVPHVGRDATLRTSAVALGGDYARLRSEALLAGQGAESDQLAVYFGDGDADARLPHAPGPRRAVHAQRPAVQGRGRRRRPARCTPVSCACGSAAQKSNAYQTNRNLVLTEGASAESIPNLEIEANDVRCSHASTVGPIDDDQLYYLESPRRPARRSRAPDRARVLRRRVRAPAGQRADAAGLRRTVVEKLEHRRARGDG